MPNSIPAVVLGLNPNGLGIVRSLHSVGVPTIGVDQKPDGAGDAHRWMSSRTRLCRKVFYRQTDSDGLLKCLLSLGKTLPNQGVLLPSGDGELLCISRNRQSLAEHYRFQVPDSELVELLANKTRFYPFAEQNGIPLPLTFVDPSPNNIGEITAKISYPCLIKPNLPDDNWARNFEGHKVFTASNPSELTELFNSVYPKHPDIVVQEIITGSDDNLYFSHAYMSEDLKPLAIWTGRKIRQLPIHFGTSTMTESVWVEAVANTTVEFLQKLGCRGYASIEFKKDLRDGQFKVMEVTQGRTWYPHYLGFGAGINIPHIWYQDLLDEAKAVTRPAIDGVRWIDEYRDLISSYHYWKQGELGILDWLRSFRGRKVFAYASLKDPLPIIFVALQLFVAAKRVLSRRLRHFLRVVTRS